MNIFEKYVTDYMITGNDQTNDISKKIVELVNEDDVQANLLKLIQTMGLYLTHGDESVRSKAIGLLTFNINHCNEEKLNESAVSVLVNFYCSRLSDHICVPNLMPGLAVLTRKYRHFSPVCSKLVVKSLNNELHVQSFPHLTRNAAFQIFENLLTYHLNDVQHLENEFIPGFIRSITGEKDPRNLMTVYSIIQIIVSSLDITNHVETLFDATFCYFPITFRPPPDNPYGITARDLKLNLRNCMASTPLFSKFALPLLLQKLATTSGTAKKDALETLTACVKVYPTDELLALGIKLYDAIKVEILNGDPDPGLREPSLDAIHALTKALTSQTDASKHVEVTRVIKPLVEDCATLLDELDEDSVKPASLILRSIASASPFVYSLVESVILPKSLRQYRDKEDVKDTYLILCTMVAIIQARKMVYGPIIHAQKNVDVDHDSILESYKDRFREIFSSSIQKSEEHPEVRLMGILGLGLLCVLNDYMSSSDREKCIEVLSHVLETEEEERLRNSVEMSLTEISSFDTSLISKVMVPILMNNLPDFSTVDTNDNVVPYKVTLSTIVRLCTPPVIYVNTEQHLLRKFIYICSHNEDRKYAFEIINTLLKLVQSKNEQQHADVKESVTTLIHPLLIAVVSATLDETSDIKKVIILNPEIIQTINIIILTIFHNLNASEQFDFASKITTYFQESNLSDLGLTSTPQFQPLASNVPERQVACTHIYATLFSAFRKEAAMPITESYLDDLLDKTLKSNYPTPFSRIIAAFVNKQEYDDVYLDRLIARLDGLVQAKLLSALTVYIWVTKGLVTRGHKKGFEMMNLVIQWIPDPVIGKHVSGGFDVIIGDDPLCLNKLSFANISLLYKQKLMEYALPKLLDKLSHVPTEDEKLNYFIALAYFLKNVPKTLLVDKLPPLMPLLIESLLFPEPVLQSSTLDLLQFVLNEATDIMNAHIKALLPALMPLIEPPQNMKIRISALTCLELISTKVPRDLIFPFASDTIKSLAIPLDDRKRLVRKQAVECREKWYLLCN